MTAAMKAPAFPAVAWAASAAQRFLCRLRQLQPAGGLQSLGLPPPPASAAQVVSGDQAGTILMWNAQNGACEGGFAFSGSSASPGGGGGGSVGNAGASKLTAMAFDSNQRRLLTASEAGGCAGREGRVLGFLRLIA